MNYRFSRPLFRVNYVTRRGKLHAALKFASSALRCEYRCSELGNKSVSTMDESHSDIFLSGSVDDLNDEGDHVSQESQNLIDTRSIEAIPSSGSGKVQSEWHQVSLDTDDPGAIPAVHLNLCAVLSELGRHRAALDHARSAVGILKFVEIFRQSFYFILPSREGFFFFFFGPSVA